MSSTSAGCFALAKRIESMNALWLLAILAGASALGCERFGSAGSNDSPRRHEVEIKGFQYKTAELRVNAGDTIVWINRDIAPHTATADKAWDTGRIDPNATRFVVARGQGEQAYSCTYHPNMQAKLVVR